MNIFVLLLALFVYSCARAPLENKEMALRKLDAPPSSFSDDLDIKPFLEGIRDSIKQLKSNEARFGEFQFGERVIYKEDYIKGLENLIQKSKNKDKQFVLDYIRNNFDFYEVYGRDKPGEILLTSYFAPLYNGRKKADKTYSQPLYKLPKDLVEVSLKDFKENEDYNLNFEEVEKNYVLGRLDPDVNDRGARRVFPYYSREQIDMDEVLSGRKLEIAYVDPVDAFFLQIQGSGVIRLKDGQLWTLGYSGQNGRKYEAIGKFLLDKIPVEEMSMGKIEDYLRSLNMFDQYKFMAKNPSYVFFRKIDGRPITTLGTRVVDGRTMATDAKFFPKGAIGFLQVKEEDFKINRLVLDHDTGGAIYGGGRADLFWGIGKEAQKMAGPFRKFAKLYFLAPR